MIALAFANRKLMTYGLAVLATLLIVFGIYRAGGKAAQAASLRRSYERCVQQLKVKDDVQKRINTLDADGIDRLRNKWTRAG